MIFGHSRLEKAVEKNSNMAIRDYSERHLFATDKFPEMVGIAAVNMMIVGDGVANIYRADATDHFGPIIDLQNSVVLLKEFEKTWDDVKRRIRSSRAEVVEYLEEIEDNLYNFAEHIVKGLELGIIKIDVSSDDFLAFNNFIYTLKDNDVALRRLLGLSKLARIAEYPSINYLIKRMWSRHNGDVRRGFDLILTNPPMGRAGKGSSSNKELLIKEPHILAQYVIAQNEWVYKMSKKKLKELAKRLGASVNPEKVADKLGREWLTPEDYANYKYKVILKDSELGWEYPIYYDGNLQPILLSNELPIQVILLEQFLRVVTLGGKVFTVIDVGVLNNPGDEWIRRLLFTAEHTPVKAKLMAVIELPHGAFYYTEAGTKTALLFYERTSKVLEDYEFFVALAEYIGYDTHSKKAEPIKENDLPLIIAEYFNWIGRRPEFYEKCKEEWRKERTCSWWIKEFEVIE